MNKNELKRMLSEVDEEHIEELLDSTETTSNVTVIGRKSRFGQFAAIAAVACLCIGGGVAVMRMLPQPPLSDVSTTQPTEEEIVHPLFQCEFKYDITPKEFACNDYVYEAGGEIHEINSHIRPFAETKFSEMRSRFFCDENGRAVNYVAHLKDGEKSIDVSISDKGTLFPGNFFVDIDDSKQTNPVIHVYKHENLPKYELFYQYNGIGMTMVVSGYSGEEAEDFAAALLMSGTTAQKLYAQFVVGYDLIWESVPERQLIERDPHVSFKEEEPAPVLPFALERFDTTSASFGTDEQDNIVYAFFGLADGQKTQVTIRVDDRGYLYNENFEVDCSEDAQLAYPVLHIYDCSWEDSEAYELYCLYNGVGLSIHASDISSDVVIDMAANLMKNHATATSLYRDAMGSSVTGDAVLTLEELQSHEAFAFAAPQNTVIGELTLREDSITITTQPNAESDTPEIIHTLFYRYENDESAPYNQFIACKVANAPPSDSSKNTVRTDAASLTEDALLRDGLQGKENLYTFDYLIPVENFYFSISALCTVDEMWAFCQDVLHRSTNAHSAAQYQAKETYDLDGGKSYIRYPFQEGGENADAINALIAAKVEAMFQFSRDEEYLYLEDGAACQLYVNDFRITRDDDQYLSIVWTGDWHVTTAPHPNQFAEGLIIDKQTLTAVTLSDLYRIDDSFVQKLQTQVDAQLIPALAEKLGISESEIPAETASRLTAEGLQESGKLPCRENAAYLTQTGVVIAVSVPHYLGDFCEVEIPYGEIEGGQ